MKYRDSPYDQSIYISPVNVFQRTITTDTLPIEALLPNQQDLKRLKQVDMAADSQLKNKKQHNTDFCFYEWEFWVDFLSQDGPSHPGEPSHFGDGDGLVSIHTGQMTGDIHFETILLHQLDE